MGKNNTNLTKEQEEYAEECGLTKEDLEDMELSLNDAQRIADMICHDSEDLENFYGSEGHPSVALKLANEIGNEKFINIVKNMQGPCTEYRDFCNRNHIYNLVW